MNIKYKVGAWESAFPVGLVHRPHDGEIVQNGEPGISKRLYIAVEAMKACIEQNDGYDFTGVESGFPIKGIVKAAFEFADEMLAQEFGLNAQIQEPIVDVIPKT